jgi:hypothetical protein
MLDRFSWQRIGLTTGWRNGSFHGDGTSVHSHQENHVFNLEVATNTVAGVAVFQVLLGLGS